MSVSEPELWPELWEAAFDNDVACVRRCLARGDEVDGRGGWVNSTPLIEAARHTDPTALLLLLHHGADMEACDDRGWTALHEAAFHDSVNCVRVLTALGADINACDIHRRTPVMVVAVKNHAGIVRVLEEVGADCQAVFQKRLGYKEVVAVLEDPATLRWGHNKMSDEDMKTRLQSLPRGGKYRVLLVNNNRLTRVPDLTQYPQLTELQVVNLANNRLTEVKEEHLPASVKTVYLGDNNIHTMSPQLVSDWLHSYFHLSNKVQSVRRQYRLHQNPIVADIQRKVKEGIFDIYGSFCDTQPVDRLPDLSHMETVREVFLPYQDISHINVKRFPAFVENINLNHNMIEDMPDIKELKCLRNISLHGNKLTTMPEFSDNMEYIDLASNNISDATNFPVSVKELNLNANMMSSLPNMKHMKSLRKISLSNNKIVVMFGLPSWLRSIDMIGNPIHTLHRACFPSEEVYKLLSEALTSDQIDKLQQPPPQIFRRGYEAVIQYYDQANISQLTDNYSNRLAVVGEALAGKTSLIQTLIHGVPCLTGEEDRTEVVQTHTWRLPDDCTYQVFDQGGHKIYDITNRFFLSTQSKNLICHNIKEGSIGGAKEMLENILHQFPNGHIHFGLTKLDLIKDVDVQNQEVNNFQETILKTFEEQITLLKSQKKDEIYVNLIKSYESRKKSVRFFPVSSLNVQGLSEVKSFFLDIAKENKQVVPQHWLDCLESIQKEKKLFFKLWEYQHHYEKCYDNEFKRVLKYIRDPSAENQKCLTSLTSLRFFSDCGLVIWYEDHPKLKGFVFHNIQYLISLMKCVFRHNLVDHLNYDANADLQREFNKTDYTQAIDEFQTQGLISLKLLNFVWKDEFTKEIENKDEVLELMKCLDICHEVFDKNYINAEKKYFFPWFVTERKEPCILRNMFDNDNSHIMLHLECIFFMDIPINVTEQMIVHLQRLAYEEQYFGERKAWKDGLFISDGDLEASVLRRAETHSLQIYLKDEVEEIFAVWKNFQKLKESLLEILSHWHGIVERIHIPCFHCVYVKKSEPKLWPLKDVFGLGGEKVGGVKEPSEERRKKVYTSCSGDRKVPAALVTMINTGDDEGKQTKHIQAVEDFLRSNKQASSGGMKKSHRGTATTLSLNEPHSSGIGHSDTQTSPDGNNSSALGDRQQRTDPTGISRLVFSRDTITNMLQENKSEGWIESFSNMVNFKLTLADLQNIIYAMCYSCYLKYPGTLAPQYTGTGFFLGFLQQHSSGKTLSCIVTSYHHLLLWAPGSTGHFVFDRYDDVRGNYTTIDVSLDNVIYSDKRLDYALFAVDNDQLWQRFRHKDRPLNLIFMPQSLSDLPEENSVLALLGHPEGKPMHVDSIQIVSKQHIYNDPKVGKAQSFAKFGLNKSTNLNALEDEVYLYYYCTSFGGTSGSPCYRFAGGQAKLYAMHSGGMHTAKVAQPGDVSDYEFGVFMCAIIRDIEKQRTTDFSWI